MTRARGRGLSRKGDGDGGGGGGSVVPLIDVLSLVASTSNASHKLH